MLSRQLVMAAATLLTGCVSVASTTTYSETLISRRRSVHTVPSSLRYLATAKPAELAVIARIRSVETCRTQVTPVFRKVAHIKREAAPGPEGALGPGTSGAAGLLGLGMGVYSYAAADTLAIPDPAADPTEKPLTADDYRLSGALLAGTGVALLGIALIDAVRLTDDDRVIGNIDGDPDVSEEPCHLGPVSGTEIVASAARGAWAARATTDDDGRVRLDLRDLTEDALTSDGLELTLSIDEARVVTTVPADATAALLAQLAAEPTTRVARDREARARAGCAEQVARATGGTIDVDTSSATVAGIESAWRQARTRCDDRWTPEHEQAFAAFRAQVQATTEARAIRDCAEAGARGAAVVAELLEDGEPLDDEAVRDDVSQRCEGAPNQAAVVARVVARLKEAERDRARAQRLEAIVEALNGRLGANDAVGLRALVARDRDAAAVLRTAPGTPGWLVELARHWIGQLERGGSAAALRPQLCAARGLVQAFVGQAAWNKLRADVARRGDVARAARIAKELDGGSCP